jgi:hypothetical protein
MSEITDAIAQAIGSLVGLPVVGLAGRLLLIGLVILWLAAAWWVWRDAGLRTGDPLLRAVATAGIVLATPFLFPFAAVVYLVLRPPLPGDPGQALELRLTELTVGVDPDRCPHCSAKVAAGWQRCPACGHLLTAPCPACGEPVGLDWLLCAWCASELPWVAEPADIRPVTPAVAMPIVPGGRPLVPVMAVPDAEEWAPSRLVGAAAAAARARQLRQQHHHDFPPRDPDRELRRPRRHGSQPQPGAAHAHPPR